MDLEHYPGRQRCFEVVAWKGPRCCHRERIRVTARRHLRQVAVLHRLVGREKTSIQGLRFRVQVREITGTNRHHWEPEYRRMSRALRRAARKQAGAENMADSITNRIIAAIPKEWHIEDCQGETDDTQVYHLISTHGSHPVRVTISPGGRWWSLGHVLISPSPVVLKSGDANTGYKGLNWPERMVRDAIFRAESTREKE